MQKSDYLKLEHILVHCSDIANFIERFGTEYSVFVSDRLYFNAVSMSILQVGELANGLSEEFRKETASEMPWGMIRGMRNWLAHAYGEIDEDMIWDTAVHDIPKVADFCRKKLNDNNKQV